MTYYQAIQIAVDRCEQEGQSDVADVLRQLPQFRMAENANEVRRKLKAVGINLDAVLAELQSANVGNNPIAQARANAKLELISKILEV
jgi:hypothetical protein